MADEIRKEDMSPEEADLRRRYPDLFLGSGAEEVKQVSEATKVNKEYAESIRELESAFKGAHGAFKILFKLMEDKGFREALKDSKELKRALREIIGDVEHLKRATDDFEVGMKKLGMALTAPASEFNRELDRSLGYFGGIKRVVEDVGETVRQNLIERVKGAEGVVGKTALGFLYTIPVWGAIIGLGMWGRTLQERYAVIGRQITSILETVSNATEKNVRIWLQAGSILGSELTGMAAAWYKLPEEIKGYAEAMTKAFAVAIDVSRKTGRAVADTIKDITEMGMTLSMRFGMSIGEVANKIDALGKAWGRTTQLSRITERWFGVLSGRVKDLALRSDEFVGVVDKMRSQFGLLGLYMENSARIASVLGDVFNKNNVFLKGYGVEGVLRMTEGLAGFENRLKSNVGTFLFFSGALEKPLSSVEDLWKRTVKMGEEYKQGGVFSLAIKAYDKMVGMVGEPGAKFWTAQLMGLSADQYPVFDKFISEFKRISKDNEETGKLMAQYLKTGDREVLKQLGERGVKIEDMEKLRKDVKGLSESLTDPLKRIEILVRDVVYHLAGVMAGLLKIIIGLLTGIALILAHPFRPGIGWGVIEKAFGVGWDEVKKGFESFIKSAGKAGKEVGDILLGVGDVFKWAQEARGKTPPKKTPEEIQAERFAEFKELLKEGQLVPIMKRKESKALLKGTVPYRVKESERDDIIREFEAVEPSEIESITGWGGQIIVTLKTKVAIDGFKVFSFGRATLNQRSTPTKE